MLGHLKRDLVSHGRMMLTHMEQRRNAPATRAATVVVRLTPPDQSPPWLTAAPSSASWDKLR
jgi:hypothetical protein